MSMQLKSSWHVKFLYATDCSHGTRCHRQDDIQSQMYMYILLKGQIRLHNRHLPKLEKICLNVKEYSAQATCHLPCLLQGIDQCCIICCSGPPVTPRFCFTDKSQYWTIWHGSSQFLVWALMATMVLTFLNFAKHHTSIYIRIGVQLKMQSSSAWPW